MAAALSSTRLWLGLALSTAAIGAMHADEVDDFVATQMAAQHIPGLSLAVLKGGQPLKVKSYGVANLELGTPVTPESVFMIGSLSKQFIAAGVVLLSREGRVGLEDSVRKFLPDAPDAWQPITVRHALTHTGGFPREAPGFDPVKPKSDADVIRTAYAVPLAFRPGEKFDYSNLGYFVLAEIIHRSTQKPWPQFLQERLFAPLGLNSTRTTTVEALVPHRVAGYEWRDGQYLNGEILIGVRPSGAFLSSIQDLAKWEAALCANAPLTPPERELMWTPVKLNDGSEQPYGLGWRVDKMGRHRLVHHAGTIGGFRVHLARFVDDGLTVIVLTNSGLSLPEKITTGVAACYISDLLPKRKAAKLPAEDLDACTGQYQAGGGRLITVSRRDDKLAMTMSFGNRSVELGLFTPESKTRFFNADDPRSTHAFIADAQGRRLLVIENKDGKEVQRLPKLGPQK